MHVNLGDHPFRVFTFERRLQSLGHLILVMFVLGVLTNLDRLEDDEASTP